MMCCPGFPLELGGSIRVEHRTRRWLGHDDDDDYSGVSALAQRFENALLDATRHGCDSLGSLAEAVREVARSEGFQPFLEAIHSVRVSGDLLEVEFSAAGYPDRFVSSLCVHGSGSRYRLRHLPTPANVASSRHRWSEEDDAPVCVGEALDADGVVLARVSIRLESLDGGRVSPQLLEGGPRQVEAAALRLARATAFGHGRRVGS